MTRPFAWLAASLAIVASALLVACGGDSGDAASAPPAVTIKSAGANPVSYWNEIASATIN